VPDPIGRPLHVAPNAPPTPQAAEALLARLLVEFDPLLAAEVREHLQATADTWDPPDGRDTASPRAELAARYRALSALIEALTPTLLAGS
jgi:hypothetical protein